MKTTGRNLDRKQSLLPYYHGFNLKVKGENLTEIVMVVNEKLTCIVLRKAVRNGKYSNRNIKRINIIASRKLKKYKWKEMYSIFYE